MTTDTPVAPIRSRLRPLGLAEARITGGFWGRRQQVNAAATIAHCLEWTERMGWVGNFRAAAEGLLPGARRGREFSDSEVYKLMEAMAWQLGREPDPALEARFAELTGILAAAQEPDGYLNTMFGRPGQRPRYSDLAWGHELYCYGHLLQAAVARLRSHGEDALVALARRVADHVCETFGPDGAKAVCGHAGIEPALAEFARATGEARYLEQARLFLERRGRGSLPDIEHGRKYYQDELPVRDAETLRGHAVRALYLLAGTVDVAVDTGDAGLLDAAVRQWAAGVARRTHLTGGMGAQHSDEGFGQDYALPPDRAYSESCAGVAAVMAGWRLLLATGEEHYADVVERVLYNVIAGAVAPDGRSFFYANTLHQREHGGRPPAGEHSPRASSSQRAPWFEVSCCPTNLARTFAALGAYLATADDDGLQLHQYADSSIRTVIGGGRRVGIDVATAYPEDGTVRITVAETDGSPWSLRLRVPPWAEGARLVTADGARTVETGAVTVTRAFAVGEAVVLELPVRTRWTLPHPRIDAVRGCVAAERGPVVLCAESVDLPGTLDVSALRFDASSPPNDFGQKVTVTGRLNGADWTGWPYRDLPEGGPAAEAAFGGIEVPLVPYHARALRGPATMRVWLPG